MRHFINIINESDGPLRKGSRSSDDRDQEQKLIDLINHPSTNEHLREVARRKLERLIAERNINMQKAAAQADYDDASSRVPALNIQITVSHHGFDAKPLDLKDWNDIYLAGNGKKLSFRTVIERLLPLMPFRIDFEIRPDDAIGPNVRVWFHPEDEPETSAIIQKALEKGGTIWAGVSDQARYYKGGTASYFVSFAKYARSERKFNSKPKPKR